VFYIILFINIIMAVLMYFIPPIVIKIRRLPFGLSAISFWLFIFIKQEYVSDKSILKHEIKHFLDCRLFTPLIYYLLYLVLLLYTYLRYRNLGMMSKGSNIFEKRAYHAKFKANKQKVYFIN